MYAERTCTVCGKSFTPKARSEAQYCSKRCASLKTYSPDQLEAPVLTAQEVAKIKAKILIEKFKRRHEMLTAGERETRLSMMGDDHSQWDVFTDDPMWISRLDKIATAYKANGEGKWYKLRADQVVVRAGVSEAKREAGRKSAKNLQVH